MQHSVLAPGIIVQQVWITQLGWCWYKRTM